MTHKLGVLGITRKTRPAMSRPKARRTLPPALWLGVKEKLGSWLTGRCPISAASLPGAKPPTRSAVPCELAQISGQVATIGLARAGCIGGGTLDIDRAL